MNKKVLVAFISCGICLSLVVFAVSQQDESANDSNLFDAEAVLIGQLRDMERRIANLELEMQALVNPPEDPKTAIEGIVPFGPGDRYANVLSLSKSDESTYVKFELVFEVEHGVEELVANAADQAHPLFMNSLVLWASGKSAANFQNKDGLNAAKNELKQEFNNHLEKRGLPRYIDAIRFTKLMIQ